MKTCWKRSMTENRLGDVIPSRNAVPSLQVTNISLMWEKAEVDGDAEKPQAISYRDLQ